MQDLNDKVKGSSLTATEWNEVPSEIQQAITDSGQTLSSGDLTQLSKAIGGYSKADKTAAALITPVSGKTMFVESTDGGLFKAATGAAPGTYSDNGGSYCGTVFIPTGGDGSAAWVRVYDKAIDPAWFGQSVNLASNLVNIADVNTGDRFILLGYLFSGDGSGGVFYWDAAVDKADHDGGVIIDPNITYPSDWDNASQVATWFTAGTGSGCWVRVVNETYLSTGWYGASVLRTSGSSVMIQQALDQANLNGNFRTRNVRMPEGRFYLESTIYIPEGITFYGVAQTETSGQVLTRLEAVSGQDFDLIGLEGHLQPSGLYWWYGTIRHMSLLGASDGTAGHGIHCKDSSGNNIAFQDTSIIHDVSIREMPESGIKTTEGGVPMHFRDLKITLCGEYAIHYTEGATFARTISVHFDNISMDANSLGGIYVDSIDRAGNIIFTNIKSETRTDDGGVTMEQPYVIIFNDCDRTSIVIDGIHSQVNDNAVTPLDMIRITGDGCPSIVWNSAAARIHTDDTTPELSYVLNDTITGRTIHARERQGMYNTKPVERGNVSNISLTAASGVTIPYTMDTTRYANVGAPILGSICSDYNGLVASQAYMDGNKSAGFRMENFTAGTINISDVNLRIMRIPDDYFKTQVSATYDPASITDGALTSTTLTVPCSLGDMVMFSHATDPLDTIGTCYVSATNTVTVQYLNETGGTVDIASGLLKAYVFNESAFRLMSSKIYNPASINDGASTTTSMPLDGAVVGDIVVVSFSLDLQNIVMSAYVSATSVVTVTLQNETGGTLNLGSGTLVAGIINTDK